MTLSVAPTAPVAACAGTPLGCAGGGPVKLLTMLPLDVDQTLRLSQMPLHMLWLEVLLQPFQLLDAGPAGLWWRALCCCLLQSSQAHIAALEDGGSYTLVCIRRRNGFSHGQCLCQRCSLHAIHDYIQLQVVPAMQSVWDH